MIWLPFCTNHHPPSPHRLDTSLQLEQLESRQLLSINDPYLIDLNEGGDSDPRRFAEVNGTAFFSANDGSTGVELWMSDGTSAGTSLVKDVSPGIDPSGPVHLTQVNGTLFYSAWTSETGRELFRSDGTSEGTVLIKDINPGDESSNLNQFTEVNGTLFFVADDGSNGRELWKSDGTSEGTVLVKNLSSDDPIPAGVSYLRNVGGTLFFTARTDLDGPIQSGLWTSDGTSGGTVLFARPQLDISEERIRFFTEMNGTLFFTGKDDSHGVELWKTNGTSAGTVLVKDIFLGEDSSNPRYLTNVNGTLFFSAEDGIRNSLWKSDGTSAGTVHVDNVLIDTYQDYAPFAEFTNHNGTLFFFSDCGENSMELWKSDGTSAGTELLIRIVNAYSDFTPESLVSSGDYVFFLADTILNGVELWRTDGTSEGTILIEEMGLGREGADPQYLTDINGKLFFSVQYEGIGNELWMSDGTPEGTALVKGIYPGDVSSTPSSLINLNGTLFFNTTNGVTGNELWKSDGTTAGTELVKDIHPGFAHSNPQYLTNLNGTLFFRANDGSTGYELWMSDGTSGGTLLVKDINPLGDSNPKYFTEVNGTIFFRANDGVSSFELWRTDGTSAGTQLVKDIRDGERSLPRDLVNVDGTLFFTANDGSTGRELWKSDGTSAGTVLVKDLNPTPIEPNDPSNSDGHSAPEFLVNFNGTLYFVADSADSSLSELWRTDGTSAGTELVMDLSASTKIYGFTSLIESEGKLFFGATSGADRIGLWMLTDDSNGPHLVVNTQALGIDRPYNLTVAGNTIYFTDQTETYEHSLWKTELHSWQTEKIQTIEIAPGGQFELIDVGAQLYFTSLNGSVGSELWRTDGTSAGTELVKNLNPTGELPPRYLTNVNGTLFFTVDDGIFGEELGVYDTRPNLQISPSTGVNHEETILFTFQFSEEVFGFELSDIEISGGTAGNFNIIDGDTYTLEVTPLLEDGEVTVTVAAMVAQDGAGLDNFGDTATVISSLFEETPLLVTGSDSGGPAIVRVFDMGGNELFSYFPFTEAFTGGVRVATGDINGDGILDIVTAAGPGGGPHVQVFDSQTGELITGSLNNFYAYAPTISVGVYVAVGDVNGDGYDDIITSPDAGGGPHIKVFSGKTGEVITEFYAYAPEITVGVRIAAGDIDNNETAEIITAPGPGGGPHIRVFSGVTGLQMNGPATNFYAYSPDLRMGYYVAAGDINGDGYDDIITGLDAGGEPNIQVISSSDGSTLYYFNAYHSNFRGGVRVGSIDLNGDGFANIIAGPGPSGGPHVRAFSGFDLSDLSNFYAGPPSGSAGLFVAGGISNIPIVEPSSMRLRLQSVEESQTSPDSLTIPGVQKKQWWDDFDEFYSQSESIDDLFSGLGIR
ncbi:Hypothetical protein PBC10988_32250 [Planctomycetales bacterium 10988]|nr:Hypothetical protein PBC10988_32250 [Planctomycetales bacterium 10988]